MSKNIYTSVACNRTPDCADWGRNGLIVYGACNAVCVLDPQYDGDSIKITHTFVEHTQRVNAVQWLRDNIGSPEILCISGADDGLAIVWDVTDIEAPRHYPLKGHVSGVNAVAGALVVGRWMLATASADSNVRLWQWHGDRYVCFQQLPLNAGYCLTLRLTVLPRSNMPLLALGLHDCSIALYAQQRGKGSPFVHDEAKMTAEVFEQFYLLHDLLGHEDWVRGLDFVYSGGDVLLASGSQDNFIRLWRFSPRSEEQAMANIQKLVDTISNSTDELRLQEKHLKVCEGTWIAVRVESVLYGHEGWVYGVQWHKAENGALQLLSASIDKSLIIWEPTVDGIWLDRVRVGGMGGYSVGFFGGKFAPHGNAIMGHSYQGSFHIWNSNGELKKTWTPNIIVGGHYSEVRDIAWEPKGEFLISVSADQTTRLHAPWRRKQGPDNALTWHEMARPQVHGYDMQAVAILSRYKFASGADEKIIRVFQASGNFIENFRRLGRIENEDDEEGEELMESIPKGASVPSLGLTNKAVYEAHHSATPHKDRHFKDEYPEHYFVPIHLEAPPQEETLMQNTLWPEVQKLYGHGFEIHALAATPDGKILASSCRATVAKHANIILWNTKTGKQIQQLPSHTLTVVQMCFSPDGQYLLSVSRDRRWSLFKLKPADKVDQLPEYHLVASTNKANCLHARIIWTCDWSHDSSIFATGSRDGKVIVWSSDTQYDAKFAEDQSEETLAALNGWQAVDSLELKQESITALAFAKQYFQRAMKEGEKGNYMLAVGLESGLIKIYRFAKGFMLLQELDKRQAHHMTVRRLQFRPWAKERNNEFQLASCGDDNLVRIIDLTNKPEEVE